MTSKPNNEDEQAAPFKPDNPNLNNSSETEDNHLNQANYAESNIEEPPLPGSKKALLFIANIFYSPRERRLRSFWRLFIQYSSYLLLLLGFTFCVILIPQKLFKPDILSSKFLELIAVTVSVFLSRILLDRKTIVSLGLRLNRLAWWDLLLGFLIAGAMIAGIYALEWIFGWLDFKRFAWTNQSSSAVISGSLSMLVIFIMVGWQEELFSRGYQLQNLEDGLNLIWGIMLSSTFFALQHLGNPNISIMGIAGLIVSGIFLAFAYFRTRQLWLPIGIHIGWNFFEGTVFGYRVSGLDIYRIIEQNVRGPELITGGAFGPEAGLILLPGLAIGAALVYWITQASDLKKETGI